MKLRLKAFQFQQGTSHRLVNFSVHLPSNFFPLNKTFRKRPQTSHHISLISRVVGSLAKRISFLLSVLVYPLWANLQFASHFLFKFLFNKHFSFDDKKRGEKCEKICLIKKLMEKSNDLLSSIYYQLSVFSNKLLFKSNRSTS